MEAFKLFTAAVKKDYIEKKTVDALPEGFLKASPANLRNYCLTLLAKGLLPDDLLIFKQYFNPIEKYTTLEHSIKKVEIDQLRPLQNFLKGQTLIPSELNVKLVAILIDFPLRPFKSSDWNETTALLPNEYKPARPAYSHAGKQRRKTAED